MPATRDQYQQMRAAAEQAIGRRYVAPDARLRLVRIVVARLGVWRLRAHVAPFVLIGGLWGVGAVVAAVPQIAAVVVLGWALAVGITWGVRRGHYDDDTTARRAAARRVGRTTVLGAGWLGLAAWQGAWGWPAALLWAGGYASSAGWWTRHHIPTPPAVAPIAELPAAPEVPVLEPADPAPVEPDVATLWAQRIGAKDRVLAGSMLTGYRKIGPADAWDIHLNPGVHATGTAIAAAPLIASGISRGIDQVTVDRHPSGVADKALLLVVDRANNPLQRTNPHPGPEKVYNAKTGYGAIGIHPDEAHADWAFVIPDWGLAGGVIFGSTGSGKSTLMTNLAVTAAYTRCISVWAGDPQGGQSIPAIIRRATWPATDNDEILLQLRAGVAAIKIRGVHNSLRNRDLHIPTPAEPGILLILDEIHKIFIRGSEHAHLASLIAREGRKAGVAMIGADQYAGLPTFGDDSALRDNMMAKNLAVLRLTSKSAKGMIPGLDLDPSDLPDVFPDGSPTSGLGYLVGSRRTAPFRGWHTPAADAWMAAAPQVELDRVTAAFIGDDYVRRAERVAATRAEQARMIADFDPDALAALLAADPTLATVLRTTPRRPARPTPAATAAPARTTSDGSLLTLAPLAPVQAAPTLAPLDDTPATPAGPRPAVLDTPGGARIYALLQAGVTRAKDLIEQSGVGKTRAYEVLTELVDAHLVLDAGHGQWALAPTPTRAAR
ncbi:ATPase AAA [Pseudofrankia inefficax]|uniref:Uncharacterized protein n=1 Tax=Pseudofrankia inefficax (strain DSM 45817 / CECT 9037 / DDB 130130 / EuI1c) TaxID=298654 RepID=E3IX40_PSEI1|nr:ATPase AAA [Pseudofrankia inefficax]ADP83812.1 hypothetical protein FraEuI1c_5828 [Pseudofrankia inefficax]